MRGSSQYLLKGTTKYPKPNKVKPTQPVSISLLFFGFFKLVVLSAKTIAKRYLMLYFINSELAESLYCRSIYFNRLIYIMFIGVYMH